MSKNWKFGDIGAGVTLRMPAAEAARAGDVANYGNGLLGYVVADEGDTQIVRLAPVQGVVELPLASGNATATGGKVYGHKGSGNGPAGSDVYEYKQAASAGGWDFIGYVVSESGNPAAGNALVFITPDSTFAITLGE